LEVKMANDSQRDKARATFGKTFFENSKALPNPKNAAAALQKRANDRPIPTYKVGGAVKKATPPQPTAAEREAERKRRESLAKAKVTQSEADTLGRAMRSEGPGYKHGGKIAKYKQGSGATSSSAGRGSDPIQNLNYNLLSGSSGGGGVPGGGGGFRLSPTMMRQPSSDLGRISGTAAPKGVGVKGTLRFKKGGTAEKRAMKAEQDFTGLMRDAAARAAAKGTPVMKDGGATNEYTAKRVMSRIKAGNFKEGGRADMLRDRRMKDIEKDYKIALAKGKNEGVAKAKYEQRKADAADDYAKRTKADRTATRAAEKASEAALTEARRTKGMSITRRDMATDFKKYFADKPMTAKAAEPAKAAETAAAAKPSSFNAAFKAARKDLGAGKTFTYNGKSYTTNMAGEGRKSSTSGGTGRVVTPARVTPVAAAPAAAAAPTAAAAPAAAKPQAFSTFDKTAFNKLKAAANPRDPKQVAYEKFLADRDRSLGESLSVLSPFGSKKERAAAYEAKLKAAGKLAKGGKVEKYAAGGAGKVRKGMMKGK
jgi:hypothetical protein